MNPNNCQIVKIHEPLKLANGSYQCRWCHHAVTHDGLLIVKDPTKKDWAQAYLKIVKYYMDKKGYSKDHANAIAQKEIARQRGLESC